MKFKRRGWHYFVQSQANPYQPPFHSRCLAPERGQRSLFYPVSLSGKSMPAQIYSRCLAPVRGKKSLFSTRLINASLCFISVPWHLKEVKDIILSSTRPIHANLRAIPVTWPLHWNFFSSLDNLKVQQSS